MTNTNRIAAAIALIASTFGTGCAVDAADCNEQDCSAIETEAELNPTEDLSVAPADDDSVTAEEARGPNLRPVSSVPPLRDWVLRMNAGKADACDLRFAGYVAGEYEELSLKNCESSVIAEIVAVDTDGPIVLPFDGFNAEETKWMLLGLDISQDNPLSVDQLRLIAEAQDAAHVKNSAVTPEADADTYFETSPITAEAENGEYVVVQ